MLPSRVEAVRGTYVGVDKFEKRSSNKLDPSFSSLTGDNDRRRPFSTSSMKKKKDQNIRALHQITVVAFFTYPPRKDPSSSPVVALNHEQRVLVYLNWRLMMPPRVLCSDWVDRMV
jgi:hypothetical protein